MQRFSAGLLRGNHGIADDERRPACKTRPGEFLLLDYMRRQRCLQSLGWTLRPGIPHDQHAFGIDAGRGDPRRELEVAVVQQRRPLLRGEADETRHPAVAGNDAQRPARLPRPDRAHPLGHLGLRPMYARRRDVETRTEADPQGIADRNDDQACRGRDGDGLEAALREAMRGQQDRQQTDKAEYRIAPAGLEAAAGNDGAGDRDGDGQERKDEQAGVSARCSGGRTARTQGAPPSRAAAKAA